MKKHETTPEVKPEQKKSLKETLLPLLGVLPMALLGAFVGGWGMSALLTGAEDLPLSALLIKMALLMACFFGGLVLQFILHEGGHLVGGLLSGYGFVSFNILGLVLSRDGQGRFRLSRMQVAGMGGQCLMSPPAMKDGRFPYTLYNMGGVASNVLCSTLLLLLGLNAATPEVHAALVCIAVTGYMLALLNGLPLPVEAVQNDASNQLCLMKSEPARQALWVQMSLAAAQAKGLRLKEMPEEWFALPEEKDMDNPLVGSIAVFRANRLMDQLNFADARALITQLLQRSKGILPLYQMLLAADGTVCELTEGGAGPLTERFLTKENQKLADAMKTSITILRTRYALALLRDQDPQAAQKHLEAFEKAAQHYPNPQDVTAEREILDRIRAAERPQA